VFDWAGLDWLGLGWVELALGWVGLGWVGLDWGFYKDFGLSRHVLREMAHERLKLCMKYCITNSK
jgi:hypothetical protein